MDIALQSTLDRLGMDDPQQIADTKIAGLWKVRDATQSARVLKLYHAGRLGNEAAGVSLMELWAARLPEACVAILAVLPHAVVMDYVPGPLLGDLSRAGRDLEACEVLGHLARRLHGVPLPPIPDLVPLVQVFEALFALRIPDDTPPALRADMRAAQALARQMLATQPTQRPLHGDLHHDNVLMAEQPTVIDAKGYIGDPAFELANAMRNPNGIEAALRDPAHLRARLQVLAGAQGCDIGRLAHWAAAKCALSIAWRAKGQLAPGDPDADLLPLLLQLATEVAPAKAP